MYAASQEMAMDLDLDLALVHLVREGSLPMPLFGILTHVTLALSKCAYAYAREDESLLMGLQ